MLTARARRLHLLRLRAFFAAHDLENDLLALVQRFESIPKYCRMVHEHILTAVLGNKAQAFLIVPPFHFASGHILSPECFEGTRRNKQTDIGRSRHPVRNAPGAAYASDFKRQYPFLPQWSSILHIQKKRS